MFFYSNLVYFFFIIYVQQYLKLFYIKYHKIIRASHGQLTNNNKKVKANSLCLTLSALRFI